MTAVLLNLRQQVFSRQDLIPLQPDSLWRIERGKIRTVTWTEAGTLITLGYWGPGDLIGQPLSRISPYQIECLTSVEISLVLLCNLELDAILSQAQQTEELLKIVRQERIYLRLQQLLNWLAGKFGRPANQGTLIELPLTHQAIAEAIGTSRVTVTRLLEAFEQKGLIVRFRRHIILLPDRYSKVAV